MTQEKRSIILKISNRGLFYNDTDSIEWRHTNFPSKEDFHFSERASVYWEVEMLHFDKKKAELSVAVIDYRANDEISSFSSQRPKYPVKCIQFETLKWGELEQVMSYYRREAFDVICDPREQARKRKQPLLEDLDPEMFSDKPGRRIEVRFQYPLMKTRFKMGYIELEKKVKGLKEPVKVILENSHIIPEFDHVKPFFSKALGTRKIEISGYVEINEVGEKKVRCRSKEIDQINEDLITNVRRLRLEDAVFKPKVIAVDKSMFTPEEYYENSEVEHLGSASGQKIKTYSEKFLS